MNTMTYSGNMRYYSFGNYLKKIFGERVNKVCVDGGFTCPNRDGFKGRGGCIYCNNDSFKPKGTEPRKSITQQLFEGIEYQKKRYKTKKFIVYFQPFSNTYDRIENLEQLYLEALSHPDVVGLSIGTRPDCINDNILDMLEELAQKTHLWVEYGLQSMHDKTLKFINRGHTVRDFHNTYIKTRKRLGINVCVHIIHGLPFETKDMMLDTVKYLADIKIDGIKIHQLHVVKNTILKKMYLEGQFTLPTLDEYLDLIAKSLELLPPNVVVQRLFGLGPQELLIAPDWNLKKGEFNTLINRYFDKINCYQASKYENFNMISNVIQCSEGVISVN